MPNGKKRPRYKRNKENVEDVRLHPTIPSLDFEEQSTNSKKDASSRHSKRLQERQQHFLFQNSIGLTPERTHIKVLVNETPENSFFPAVLRGLRDTKVRTQTSNK